MYWPTLHKNSTIVTKNKWMRYGLEKTSLGVLRNACQDSELIYFNADKTLAKNNYYFQMKYFTGFHSFTTPFKFLALLPYCLHTEAVITREKKLN